MSPQTFDLPHVGALLLLGAVKVVVGVVGVDVVQKRVVEVTVELLLMPAAAGGSKAHHLGLTRRR